MVYGGAKKRIDPNADFYCEGNGTTSQSCRMRRQFQKCSAAANDQGETVFLQLVSERRHGSSSGRYHVVENDGGAGFYRFPALGRFEAERCQTEPRRLR
jgi:hypothetical protein